MYLPASSSLSMSTPVCIPAPWHIIIIIYYCYCYCYYLAHVHHVLGADVPAGAPGVGAAPEAGRAAVHCAHPELETRQDVGQGLETIIIIIIIVVKPIPSPGPNNPLSPTKSPKRVFLHV